MAWYKQGRQLEGPNINREIVGADQVFNPILVVNGVTVFFFFLPCDTRTLR